MNRNLEFRKQDNYSGVQTLPYESGALATCLEQEGNPYKMSIASAAVELQPSSKERTNYREQQFILNRVCDNNYYRVSIDVKGLNRVDFFSTAAYYLPIEFRTAPVAVNLTWADSFVETQIADKVELGFNLITERLKKIGQLKRGWDSYGAEPIVWPTIARAIDFFSRIIIQLDKEKRNNSPVPFIAPLSDGGIQFEWRTFYKELTLIIPKGKESAITYLKVEKSIFGETEEEGDAVVDEAIELATAWLLS